MSCSKNARGDIYGEGVSLPFEYGFLGERTPKCGQKTRESALGRVENWRGGSGVVREYSA